MINGHDDKGRFTPGNTEGTGRKVSALKRALEAAVTEEDITAIANALKEKAKDGDIKAAELLLNRLMGKPAQNRAEEPEELQGGCSLDGFDGVVFAPLELPEEDPGEGGGVLSPADIANLQRRGFYRKEEELR